MYWAKKVGSAILVSSGGGKLRKRERKALQSGGDHLKYGWPQQNPGKEGSQLVKE
jgi:hypothetical protein